MPTALQRSGDFSQTFTSTGVLIPIYDPATTAPNPSGNGFVRTAFPGNKVPAARMDSLALSVLKYMPLPNLTPTNAYTNANNWFYEPEGGIDDAVFILRGDHRFNASDTIFARWAQDRYYTDNPGDGLRQPDPANRNDHRHNYHFVVGETHTFSPSVLNEFRESMVRQNLTLKAPNVGNNWPGRPTAYRGQSVYWQDHDAPVPYELQWNLAVQRELPGHWTGTAAYVGSHGVRLFGGNYNYNQLNPSYWTTYCSLLQNQVLNPYYGQITTGSLASATISQSQALLPLPDYQSITTLARHGADAIYHSLEATGEHRYAHGLTALISYTKGKLIDDTPSNDSGEGQGGGYRIGRYNPRLDRSLDPTDVSQNLSANGVWTLPFGDRSHGLRYLALGGWQLNGIVQWEIGFPLGITGTNNFTGTPYPSISGNPTLPASKRSVKEWFNTAAFVNPPNYQLGNEGRQLPATRGPNFTNANTSLTKNFALPGKGHSAIQGGSIQRV